VWPSIGEYLAYDEMMYYSMTTDEVRTTAYRQALAATVPGKTVLDVGTGRDVLLARLALEAGAERVYAIEMLEASYRAGRERLEALGLDDRIHLVHGDVLDPDLRLDELVDVCVSEVIGTIGSSEGVIPLIHAARRFVKPGGAFLPEHCFTRVAAVELPEDLRRDPAFSTLSKGYTRQIFESVGKPFDLRLCLKNIQKSCLLSPSAVFEDLRLDGLAEPAAEHELRLNIERPGRLDGFLLWVQLRVAPGFEIDTLEQQTSWLPVFFPAPEGTLTVVPGDHLEMVARRTVASHPHLPDYSLHGRLVRQGKPPLDLAHHSPWQSDDHLANPFHQAVLAPAPPPLDVPELRRFLGRHLPPALVPTLFVGLEELPLLPGGKVNLEALPDPQPATAAGPREPATPMEKEIVNVWQEVLGQAPGVTEDFFISGGHSLLATRLLSRLRTAFGVDVSLEDFFAAPTVRGLAAVVEDALLEDVDEAELGALLQDLDLESATHDEA
jgi:ubiquinone/menaquinone biosynthesis C-methylase UbiE/acyl carrier protein